MATLCCCKRPDSRDIGDKRVCNSCGRFELDFASQRPRNASSKRTSSSFTYQPLRSDSSSRLVRLHAGRIDDEVTCDIFHSVLGDHPPFEALSYTWGSLKLSHDVYSSQGTIGITANCAHALQDLRHSFRDRILWIDALCIDQTNDEEKSTQVPLMNTIYAAARRVLIYVGPYQGKHGNLEQFFAYLRRRNSPGDGAVTQAAITSFLSRPWFSRVWIYRRSLWQKMRS